MGDAQGTPHMQPSGAKSEEPKARLERPHKHGLNSYCFQLVTVTPLDITEGPSVLEE